MKRPVDRSGGCQQPAGHPRDCVLLGEGTVNQWPHQPARLADLLDFARLRPLANARDQADLAW